MDTIGASKLVLLIEVSFDEVSKWDKKNILYSGVSFIRGPHTLIPLFTYPHIISMFISTDCTSLHDILVNAHKTNNITTWYIING